MPSKIETETDAVMYQFGKIARAIWPDGDIPLATLNMLLTHPVNGLALAMKSVKSNDPEIGALIAELPSPSDMPSFKHGVTLEQQGQFWTGFYHFLAGIERSKMGPDMLIKAGNLLFGERWQSDLARAVDVGDRRVREWVSGERSIPPGIWVDIAALLRQRSNEGLNLLAELDRA